MKEILLSQQGKHKGKYAVIVDDRDYGWLVRFRWHINCGAGKIYASRIENGKCVLMHRLITVAPDTMCVDHKNGNGLDNRRSNLRVCTVAQNGWNVGRYSTNTSGFKGVHWDGGRKRWRAAIWVNGKCLRSKRYKSIEGAVEAYTNMAMKYHGEFARVA